MSLINEALKKAQTDRPASERPNPGLTPGGMPPMQTPPRKKRYLLGFVLAVLIVGLLSALVSTYLVLQLIGDEESANETAAVASTEEADVALQEQAVEPAAAEAPTVPAEETVADTIEPAVDETTTAVEASPEAPQAIAEELVIEVPDAVVTEQPVAEEPAAQPPTAEPTVAEPVAAEPEPVVEAAPVIEVAAPVYAVPGNKAEIWRRLEDFEIRGIMSSKVLIHDNRSGKARTYKSGDLIDGALGLRVHLISSGEIQFTDNDGSIFSKAF